MKNDYNIMKKTAILLLVILFINQVSAFAVSSAYYEGNPLKMKPGETKILLCFCKILRDKKILA